MGGRLSRPSGPGGTTEASAPARLGQQSVRKPLNVRRIIGPIGIITLASLLWIYSRTSIRAAKENAKRHREADGGSISWRNETHRRHGVLETPKARSLLQEMFGGDVDESQKKKDRDAVASRKKEVNPIEEGIRKARESGNRKPAMKNEEE